jgi:hypothetical protein
LLLLGFPVNARQVEIGWPDIQSISAALGAPTGQGINSPGLGPGVAATHQMMLSSDKAEPYMAM